MDNPIGSPDTYLVGSDFSVDSVIQRLNIRGPIISYNYFMSLTRTPNFTMSST